LSARGPGAGPEIDAGRVIEDLRELERRTADDAGAQRLCWGPGWRTARELLDELLEEVGVSSDVDEAGNLWAYLEGERGPALTLGSHIDSVPDGGWLDGALGVMAAVGALRAWTASGRRPSRTLALADFADEEGARFGRSLFGSSIVAGSLEGPEIAGLRDAEGHTAAEVLAENGVELERASAARSRALRIGAYLELHIEQGPVLESERRSCSAVAGCAGVERGMIAFAGQSSHAGTTPMDARRDAGLAAAEAALALEDIGRGHGGVATSGVIDLEPGILTAVAGRAGLGFDLRHADPGSLAAMRAEAEAAARRAAAKRGCEVEIETIWRIAPILFDAGLVANAAEACSAAGGRAEPLTSGALHDAAEIAGVAPAAMVFTSSRGGVSHAREEDTGEADLRAGIDAYGALVARALDR
jgi:N-carbamoyl-L-amino-acid hydrolase